VSFERPIIHGQNATRNPICPLASTRLTDKVFTGRVYNVGGKDALPYLTKFMPIRNIPMKCDRCGNKESDKAFVVELDEENWFTLCLSCFLGLVTELVESPIVKVLGRFKVASDQLPLIKKFLASSHTKCE
jgi:hypothetical protein